MGGFTRFDNAIYDALLASDLGKRELRLALHVYRETVGYQQEWAVITPADAHRKTRIPRQNVSDTLDELIALGYVLTSDQGVCLQPDISLWGVAKRDTSQNATCRKTRHQMSQNATPECRKTRHPAHLESANNAEVQTPKEREKKKENPSPTSPLSSDAREQEWIVNHFGISSEDQISLLGPDGRRDLKRYLGFSQVLRLRALDALKNASEPITYPIRFVLSMLSDPAKLAAASGTVVPFQPRPQPANPYADKPWGAGFWQRWRGNEAATYEVVAVSVIAAGGSITFEEAMRLFREEGLDVAMTTLKARQKGASA